MNQTNIRTMNIKFKNCLLVLLIISIVSCNGQSRTPNDIENKNSPKENKTSKDISSYEHGKDYVEFKRARIFDKIGFTQPVEASSILIPNDWNFDADIMWNAPGTACAGNNVRVKSVSSDGKYSFEMLPNYLWSFVTDPQLDQFSRQQQFPEYCSYGEPMNANDYFKNVFVPNDLGNPQILDLKDNPEGQRILQEGAEKGRARMMELGATQLNYYTSCVTATVQWSPNEEALVLCGVIITENIVANQYDGSYSKNYTSVATERIVFKYPKGEKAKATNMLGVMMASIRTNSSWKNAVDGFWREVSNQSRNAHLGRIAAIDAQTAQMGRDAINKGQQNLNNMDSNMRSWEAKQQSQDRMHTSFINTIREVENYSDASGKVELASGYNHAWSRGDGNSFIMSDNPNFDPSSVFQDQQWKEMKKVD